MRVRLHPSLRLSVTHILFSRPNTLQIVLRTLILTSAHFSTNTVGVRVLRVEFPAKSEMFHRQSKVIKSLIRLCCSKVCYGTLGIQLECFLAMVQSCRIASLHCQIARNCVQMTRNSELGRQNLSTTIKFAQQCQCFLKSLDGSEMEFLRLQDLSFLETRIQTSGILCRRYRILLWLLYSAVGINRLVNHSMKRFFIQSIRFLPENGHVNEHTSK